MSMVGGRSPGLSEGAKPQPHQRRTLALSSFFSAITSFQLRTNTRNSSLYLDVESRWVSKKERPPVRVREKKTKTGLEPARQGAAAHLRSTLQDSSSSSLMRRTKAWMLSSSFLRCVHLTSVLTA